MGTPAFDTLQFVRRLKAAGFPDAQAEALAEAFKEARAESLVTTIDLERTELSLRADIEHLGQEFAQAHLIKQMVGLAIAQLGMLAAILVKLA